MLNILILRGNSEYIILFQGGIITSKYFNNKTVIVAGVASDIGEATVIDVNLNGVFLCNKYAIEQMLKQDNGGAIVNNDSIHGFVGKKTVGAYAASKGGVKLLTQTASAEYSDQGIRINDVNPGYIDTPLLKDLPDEMIQELIDLHPIGRLGKSEEVAKAVLFLASDDASFITGASLLVDGGYTAV